MVSVNEQISALMDGEAPDFEAEALLTRMREDGDAREVWEAYHLIGDALRQSEALAGGVAARVAQRLRDEPTVLAPRRREPARARIAALSAVASVAAVAMVFWVAQQIAAVSPAASVQLAQEPANPLARAAAERLSDYMLAHQEASPAAMIHGFAPYVRTVADTRPEQRR